MDQEIKHINIEDLVLWTENPRDPIDKNATDQNIVDRALNDKLSKWTLDKLAKEYSGELLVAKVNTDENPEWATKYGVQGIPTMLFISDEKVIHRQVGALPEPMLRDVVGQFMNVVNDEKVEEEV